MLIIQRLSWLQELTTGEDMKSKKEKLEIGWLRHPLSLLHKQAYTQPCESPTEITM